jgi:hypothetical protein
MDTPDPGGPVPPADSPEPDASAPPPTAPAPAASQAPRRPPPIPQLVSELRDLVVTYVKEQTLVPLQQLGRYVGFGIAGSLLLGFGVLFLAMSGLRALQTETGDTFSGDWSWVPYLIVIVGLLLGGVLVWIARGARRAKKGAMP